MYVIRRRDKHTGHYDYYAGDFSNIGGLWFLSSLRNAMRFQRKEDAESVLPNETGFYDYEVVDEDTNL
jgi:hypothetical protein